MEIKDLIDILEKKYPLNLEEEWDNSGLQIGNPKDKLKNVLISLDLEDEAVDMAIENNCNFILTHHPYLFNAVKSIDLGDSFYNRLKRVIKNDITVFSMHTNLDIAFDGLNDNLCDILDIKNKKVLERDKEIGLGRFGYIKREDALEFAKFVKEKLRAEKIIAYGDLSKKVSKIALCGGAGSSLLDDAILNCCDVFITGDIKYHEAVDYSNKGIIIFDAGHYATENHIIYKLKDFLANYVDSEVFTYEKSDKFRTFI